MLCCGAVFAEDDFTELQEYLPIAEKLYAGKTDEALQQAEQISSRNPFASALLYLVYSRGYCDRPIDYARTALYFDKFLPGTDAYQGGFHNDEFRDVWRAMRVPPVGEQRSITLKVMNDFGMLTQQKINLKGKYPLKECYSEKMRSIGSLAGYSIWVIFCRRFSELSELAKEARRQAIRLGSIDALYSVMVPPGVGVGLDLGFGVGVPGVRGLDEGQHGEGHLAVFVRQDDGSELPGEHRREVHAAPFN